MFAREIDLCLASILFMSACATFERIFVLRSPRRIIYNYLPKLFEVQGGLWYDSTNLQFIKVKEVLNRGYKDFYSEDKKTYTSFREMTGVNRQV